MILDLREPVGPRLARPRLLVVVHEDHAGPGRLGGSAAPTLEVLRPDRGDAVPEDLTGYDGLVVLGGSMGALDDALAPWLPATRRLLATAVERGLPTLGICLGAQLLAAATGGRVERGAAGLEVGLVELRLLPAADDDRLLGVVRACLGDRVLVPQWHQDAVTELPPGAVRLATGDRYPNQAFRVGDRAWGLQYHPEVTARDWRAWMGSGHGAVRDAGLRPAELTERMVAAEAHLEQLATLHTAAFSHLVGDHRKL